VILICACFILFVFPRISEVLSSWRLGSKFKLAVNNVDSALNFVTKEKIFCEKFSLNPVVFLKIFFSQEDFTWMLLRAWPETLEKQIWLLHVLPVETNNIILLTPFSAYAVKSPEVLIPMLPSCTS